MRGINQKPVRYILEDERGEDSLDQTAFWLTAKNNRMANESIARYAKARKDNGQTSEYDDRLLSSADKAEFVTVCSKVEHFAFSDEYYQRKPQVAELADENGYIDSITDADILGDVVSELAPAYLSEIFAAVNNPVKLDRGAKKN
jgi:hypothetical protein